jgi:hypothetical protein
MNWHLIITWCAQRLFNWLVFAEHTTLFIGPPCVNPFPNCAQNTTRSLFLQLCSMFLLGLGAHMFNLQNMEENKGNVSY